MEVQSGFSSGIILAIVPELYLGSSKESTNEITYSFDKQQVVLHGAKRQSRAIPILYNISYNHYTHHDSSCNLSLQLLFLFMVGTGRPLLSPFVLGYSFYNQRKCMFFFMFPLKITQKCAYNQRKLVFFFMFPLKIGIRIICQICMTFI